MELSKEQIIRWVETNELDHFFSKLGEEDPEYFEHQVLSLCDDDMLLMFASNRNSPKRVYFAGQLVLSLCWIYRHEFDLPYHFSRMRGLMSFEEYTLKLNELAEKIYVKCRVIDSMRNSTQEEIKQLANRILDYRNDRNTSERYYGLVRELNKEVGLSFADNVTLYQPRICKTCKAEFRHWYDGNAGVDENSVRCSKCGVQQIEA
jgi:hypothetical protein